MLVPVLLFCVGLLFLIKGGDWFVDGATGIARRFHLPELLIGESYDPAEIVGGTPEENALTLRSVLDGTNQGGARASVLLNAGATIYVAGAAPTLKDGIALAGRSIDSGAALRKLEQLIEASHGTGA